MDPLVFHEIRALVEAPPAVGALVRLLARVVSFLVADQAGDATEAFPAIGAYVRRPFDGIPVFQPGDHARQAHRSVLELTDPFHFAESRKVRGRFQE